MAKNFRVALIGPESTGKTTLCRQLAAHFKTAWVREYAREYLEQLKRSYTKDDVLHCAYAQIKLEDETKAKKILFSDTEMINFKIWFEDKYDVCPAWIEQEIDERRYDLFLLTYPDLPFEDDPIRENPGRRDHFFHIYKEELEKRNFRFEVIKGKNEQRFEQALSAINKALNP